jgi:phosphoglycolate phosphatase
VRPPSALLFDWDNTLVDSWGTIHHAYNATLQAMGRPLWTLEETRARARRSARDSFPALFGDRAREAVKIFYRAFEARHLDHLVPYPGAERMLECLTEIGCYVAVVSNKRGDLLRREAEVLGWQRHFRRLVGATDAALDKPAVEAVDLALNGSGIVAGPEVWFVGDTDVDMVCAHNADCVAVLLRAKPPDTGEFAEAPPRLHVISCTALAELVSAP